jgi:predicted PurR-regulated permease PerM
MVQHQPSRTEKRAFAFLFAAAAFFFLWTVSPVWVPLFLGVLLAVVAMPLYTRLVRALPRHPRVVAAAITAIVITLVAALLSFVTFVVVRELVRALTDGSVQRRVEGAVRWLHSGRGVALLKRVGESPDHLLATLRSSAESASSYLSTVLSSLLAVTSHGLLTLTLMAITSYYLLVEGRGLASFFLRLVPLPPDESRALMHEFREACVAILLGIGVIALYQAVAGGVGFYIFGVPRPLVGGAVTGVVSLIPAIGTALTFVPMAILLFATHHTGAAVGLLIWWLVVVVFVPDYVLRPRIMEGRMRMHSLLVLISLFGGLEAFGPVGLALGPLFCALFVALLRIYERDFKPPTELPSGRLIQTP